MPGVLGSIAPLPSGQEDSIINVCDMAGNICSGMRCFLLQDLSLTRIPPRDRTTSRCDAQTSAMFGHRAGVNHVGPGGAHHRDVWLLCPHGGHVPRRVRLVSERAFHPVVPYASASIYGVRATSIAPCITCCSGTHASTKGSLRLRLG